MSEQRRKRGPGVCYSFQRGECNRGDACRYLHEAQERKRTGICYSYQRGECRRGDGCRFLHVEEKSGRGDDGGYDSWSASGRDRYRSTRREAPSLPRSKYSRGTRYDRKVTPGESPEAKKIEPQERTWVPKPSPPGSWAGIVAAAAKKEQEGDSGGETDE